MVVADALGIAAFAVLGISGGGPYGYARDNVAWGATWDIEPAAASQPVALWYGEMIPSAHLAVRNGAGHGMTCFGYWDETFAALRTASFT